MHTLPFILRQHTPLIHFQPEQEGATLRASEVKPKLDRYIIKKAGLTEEVFKDGKKLIQPKAAYSHWFIGKDTLSLNYKLSFSSARYAKKDLKLHISGPTLKDGIYVYETSPFPNFLANMGGKERKEDLKNFSYYDKIEGKIVALLPDLRRTVEKYLNSFFILHNFGNRQNKGFGSFTLDGTGSNEIFSSLENEIPNCWYWEVEADKSTLDVFTDIAIIYGLLKTGINFPDHPRTPVTDANGNPVMQNGRPRMRLDETKRGPYSLYFKSYLYQHFGATTPYGNEKRFIKEKFFKPSARITSDGSTKKYVRGVLGTAQFNEYRDRDRKGIVEFKSDEVERFASPITFKVIDNYVFFFIDELQNELIFNKSFEFKHTHNGITNRERIDTPIAFDLPDLLNHFIDYFHSLIDSVDINLFRCYENGDRDMPIPASNIIDVISTITILKLNKTTPHA